MEPKRSLVVAIAFFLVLFVIKGNHVVDASASMGAETEGYGDADGPYDIFPLTDEGFQKRGMCRPGYTYSAILRNCMPSLGVLRGRGKNRGRRTSAWGY